MLSVKAYCWEAAIASRISELRRREAVGVLQAHAIRGVNNGLYNFERDSTEAPPIMCALKFTIIDIRGSI